MPLVDWGARFGSAAAGAAEDRGADGESRAVERVASGRVDVVRLRDEARDEMADTSAA